MIPKSVHTHSIRDLGKGLRAKEYTSVELTNAFLARLEAHGPRYNAVVTMTKERALEEAARADKDLAEGKDRGALHGIPYGVKDLLATKGAPTTWGATPYREQKFDEDAEVVRRLGEAGAVLAAKLAMVELAGGMGYNHADASFTGPGLTPWNTKYWSGGSSSGPGAAIAARLVPFAVGSETSGSILTPCAYSGVTGLRPTYGLVSRRGAMALSWTLDKLGPMANSADDCGLVLNAMQGRDAGDPSSVERPFGWSGLPDPALVRRRPFRIAVIKNSTEKVQPAVRENFESSLKALGGGLEVTRDVEWPDFPWGPSVGTIVRAEGATAFLDLIQSGGLDQLTCPRDRWAGYTGLGVAAVDYLQAMRLRGPMKEAVNALFQKFDAIAAPTRATVAYPIDVTFDKAWPGVVAGPPLIPAGNLCGLPAIALPNGFGEEGLPTSISFMGPAFSENQLLTIGALLQASTTHHAKLPPGIA